MVEYPLRKPACDSSIIFCSSHQLFSLVFKTNVNRRIEGKLFPCDFFFLFYTYRIMEHFNICVVYIYLKDKETHNVKPPYIFYCLHVYWNLTEYECVFIDYFIRLSMKSVKCYRIACKLVIYGLHVPLVHLYMRYHNSDNLYTKR